ncbi:hypothetical protein [Paraliobacillus ryukyuensis]|uniref:hypothetical protein n=1 Tax=Paraliobacillus ryukyuensis TaxID=200904 RepID=UPI0009A71418|nr:hypothetical protein [Paraliobacillus ryukyuensis]
MSKTWTNVLRIFSFAIAFVFWGLQLACLVVQARYQAEYIDDRLFYLFNIIVTVALTVALLLTFKKRLNILIGSIAAFFIIFQFIQLQGVKDVTSISPDFNHVFSIKQNGASDATYYRSYYRLLGKPKEDLAYQIKGKGNIKWITNDIAVFTSQSETNGVQQFVGTYGARGDSVAYTYVSTQIRGTWKNDDTTVTASMDGVLITHGDQTTSFEWEQAKQFGTLALVLTENNEAKWTIGLAEDFYYDQNTPDPPVGSIVLYQATMNKVEPVTLEYTGEA